MIDDRVKSLLSGEIVTGILKMNETMERRAELIRMHVDESLSRSYNRGKPRVPCVAEIKKYFLDKGIK